MTFKLPPSIPGEDVRELHRASVAGGQDNMPYPTQVVAEADQMICLRRIDESGCLMTPWSVNGAGRLMTPTATLMERLLPYRLPLELARGKINQVRGQAADWLMGGLQMPSALAEEIRQATLSFCQAVADFPAPQADLQAQAALSDGFRASENLVREYMQQVFSIRHQRQDKFDTAFAVRLGRSPPSAELGDTLTRSFNAVAVPFSWKDIEPNEGEYIWEPFDALVNWATTFDLPIIGGPLLDYTAASLPEWFLRYERDVGILSGYLCDFVELVLKRYQGRITTWQLHAAANLCPLWPLSDEDLLWLTVRMVEAARYIEPGNDLIVGLGQPWGDYLRERDHTHSPFVFADTLVRAGVKLAALDLELLMGVQPRGSYCRDLMEASRILDLYALLGVPIQVSLGYPSLAGADSLADANLQAAGGHWRDGFTPEVQADWASAFGALAVCKPYVRAVHWATWSDAEPHQFPHCGVVDAGGNPKPALDRLRAIRSEHLK
jgi:hypothetical protein